jgi:hypothetical protein
MGQIWGRRGGEWRATGGRGGCPGAAAGRLSGCRRGRDKRKIEAGREVRPSPEYLDLIIAGAREHGLPEDYITGLAKRWGS